ncbi:MAG: hypothetical protein ACKOZT_09550 [Cyanobium sp.]
MTLTLPAHTLRSLAAALRQLSYVPTSWQGVLAGMGAEGRGQLEPLLVQMVREGAQPRLIAMVLEQLAEQQEKLQQERDAWSFVWSGPDPLHSRTADTYATVDQLISQAHRNLLIATYNIGLSMSSAHCLNPSPAAWKPVSWRRCSCSSTQCNWAPPSAPIR